PGRPVERRDVADVLAGQAQAHAARGEEGQARRRGGELAERRRGGQHLLQVVDDDERAALAYRPGDAPERLGGEGDAEGVGEGRADQRRVADRRRPDAPRPTVERGAEAPAELEREPRLADPARSEQGDEADVRLDEQAAELGELALAAEERR